MKFLRLTLILAATWFAATAGAQVMTELRCSDFRPTPEALERYAELEGACEGVVDRDGELYAKFTAIVRRVSVERYICLRRTTRSGSDPIHRTGYCWAAGNTVSAIWLVARKSTSICRFLSSPDRISKKSRLLQRQI